jgi:bifunctional polynucleotide phosphatase/kinase
MPKRKAATTAELEIKRSKGETNVFGLKWYEEGEPLAKGFVPLVYLYGDQLPGCSKIAAFDMDSTLINVKSGAKFARNHEDWVWWHETVPKKLGELHKDGYRLIIFTNQAGIEKLHTKLDDIKRKCEKLIEETNAPIYVFIATGENHFRKPATSMYDFFIENCNQNVEVNY